ncbi:ABC transporter ATP-binding protein [Salinarimonas soli]|uniref:sn-glycerol-3-phosphate ABC transporter ATP-binding protein UgpC n=1 Tax=Salinarimonas soli TaxID=1638099 RepID=A0A5B2W0J9_9HYPH|nr:sn-glycerol-3-phosphate ABC transporter ATP-binding protein UgpC [Salinarimonas soli]KAA2244240.1 sn-glycerol-3-phosphate ABC transporter ATP-binding protein UgpC [Salinarimonas soli]
MVGVVLRNVTKRWGSFTGVHAVDLVIGDREFVVFLGPSGCGKTTTMRMIAGLEDPSDGEILIGDRVVNDLEPKDRDVAMVFQNYGLYPNLTVYENIRFPLKVRRVDASTHDARVRKAAAMVELGDLLHRRPKELSGGQRQRVALARAIVREPAVFLMDEPLSNLDAKLRVSTRAQIKNLQHELKVTTIYVTHDQIEAMTLADRVVVMNKGRFQQVGTPTEIYDRPANTFVAGFIGSPAMNLMDGAVAAGVFEAPGVRVPGLVGYPDGPATLGFRAEDAEVAAGPGGEIAAPVYSIELLGDATLVSVRVGPALVAARAPKTFRAEIGDPVSFRIGAAGCHVFDSASGERIEPAPAMASPGPARADLGSTMPIGATA